MATEVKRRRGSSAQHGSFTGAVGEVTVDTDKDTLVVHDGATLGGFEILRQDLSNISDTDIFTKLSLETNIANLTSAEISQLENIGTLTFSAQSWANLNDISLINVADGDFIVGSATGWVAESGATARTSLGVAIGSDVQAWDAQLDTLSGLSAGAANALVGITSAEFTQIQNINGVSITNTQWGYLGALASAPLEDITGESIGDLSDVTITTIGSGELLRWNGSAWINNTPAEAGLLDGFTVGNSTFINLSNVGTANHPDITADLSATGTTDSTTYLRGDNTWAVPPFLPLAGGTLTGALSGTSATFTSDNNNLILDSGAGANSELYFATNGTNTWRVGETGGGTDFRIRDEVGGATALQITQSTQAIQLFGALTGTSATFSGTLDVNDAETHLYRNATTGNYGAQTLSNATLRIQDSSANMYIDGNSITLDQSGYLDAGGSIFSFAFNGGLKAIMDSDGFTFSDSVQFNHSITGTTATFNSGLNGVNTPTQSNKIGLELVTRAMNTGAAQYGYGIVFSSSDPDFTTTTPKYLAGIFPYGREAFSNDTDSGMGIAFYATGTNQGTTPDPVEVALLNTSNFALNVPLTGTSATFSDTTQATSSSVASVELSGGLGIAKDVFISSTSDIYTDDYNTGGGSGWAGAGLGIINGTTSDMYIDNLTVRGRLRAYELIIKQISTIGGTEIMSIAAGIVESVSGSAPNETLTIEDPRGFGGNAFAVGDLIVVQTVDLNDPTNAVKQEWRRVSSVTGNNIIVGSLLGAPASTSRIAEGDAVVAFGSDTTTSRQNIIYRNVEGGAPLVRLHAGVNSYTNFATAANTTVMAYGEMNGLVTGISSSKIGMIIGDPTLTSNYILATENQFEANLDTFTLEAGTADSLLITSDTSTQTAYTPTDDTSALVTNASLTSSVSFYGTFATVDESLGWEGDRLSFGTLSYNGTSDRIEMTMDCTGVTSSNRLRVWQDQETMTNYQNKTITFNFNLSTVPTSGAWSTTIPTHLIIYAYDSGTRREIARETIGAVSSTPADKSVTAHIPEWADSFRWAIVADEGNYTSLTTDRTLYINSITTDVYDKVQTTLNTDGLTVYGSPINELKFTKSDGVQIKGAKIRGNWMMLPEYKNENDLPTPDAGYASVAIIEVGGNKELWIRDDAGTTHSVTLT